MITADTILHFFNLLFVPVLFYVVRIEKRISIIETKCDIYFNGAKDKK